MKKNVGTVDRVLRIIVGIVIIALGIMYGSWLGIIGILPIFTALIGYCPAYMPLGISTCKLKKPD